MCHLEPAYRCCPRAAPPPEPRTFLWFSCAPRAHRSVSAPGTDRKFPSQNSCPYTRWRRPPGNSPPAACWGCSSAGWARRRYPAPTASGPMPERPRSNPARQTPRPRSPRRFARPPPRAETAPGAGSNPHGSRPPTRPRSGRPAAHMYQKNSLPLRPCTPAPRPRDTCVPAGPDSRPAGGFPGHMPSHPLRRTRSGPAHWRPDTRAQGRPPDETACPPRAAAPAPARSSPGTMPPLRSAPAAPVRSCPGLLPAGQSFSPEPERLLRPHRSAKRPRLSRSAPLPPAALPGAPGRWAGSGPPRVHKTGAPLPTQWPAPAPPRQFYLRCHVFVFVLSARFPSPLPGSVLSIPCAQSADVAKA